MQLIPKQPPTGWGRILLLAVAIASPRIWAAEPSAERVESKASPRARPRPELAPSPMSLVVGLYGGAFLPSGEHELYDSTQSFQAPFNEVGPKVGLRAGFFPFSFLGVEAEGGYGAQRNQVGAHTDIYDMKGHVVAQVPWMISPFVLGGGGFLGARSRRGGDVDGALHWGGGVKVFATPWLDFRLDGRHVISGAEGPNSGNTDHFEVTAGLDVLVFRKEPDRPKQVVVVARPEPPVAVATPPEPVRPAPEPTPEPASPEPVVEPVVLERTLYVEAFSPVQFKFDSASIPQGFLPILQEVIQIMVERPELDVVIVGHADATGSERYNQRLSERRAEAVAVFFVKRGVERPRIRVRGEGERIPIASNATRAGRARNRRTELTVVERREGAEKALEAEASSPAVSSP